MLFLNFGCPGEEAASETETPTTQTPAEPGTPTEGEHTLLPTKEENITQCQDGTKVGECSVTKPKICDVYGNLVDDAGTCGCPEKSVQIGNECIYTCEDGTLIGECSSEQPDYCNSQAQLEEKASLCGCPPGYDVDGESCRNACDDGTPKYECSTATPPLYCDGEYNLTMNPILCGCYDWEFLVGGECFDPTSKNYSNEETIRISESLNMRIGDVEEKACKDGTYVVLELTVVNSGDASVEIENSNFKLFTDERRAYVQTPSGGCTVANLFGWGEIPAGKTESGNVWFKIVGGSGTHHAEYLHWYSPTVLKEFYIYLNMED